MKRILIIEDDPLISGIYSNHFIKRGFSVEVAPDGQTGLEKVQSWKPDLVLLDLILPKVDGLSVLKTVREDLNLKDLPVIVFSNSFAAGNADSARSLGASEILSKSQTRPLQVIDIAARLLKLPAIKEELERPFEDSDRASGLKASLLGIPEMRRLLKEFFSKNSPAILNELCLKTHTFTGNAWVAGLQKASSLSSALEVLLRTLCEHPKYITLSTDRTILQGIETLEALLKNPKLAEAPMGSPSILVVDDEDIALHAASFALKKSGLSALCVKDPEEALKLVQKKTFDLILLDINMPNMDGMELCTNIRALPKHINTPVIFFSHLSDVAHRIDSATVGGSDFIGKPFLTIELAVKSLVWIVKPKG